MSWYAQCQAEQNVSNYTHNLTCWLIYDVSKWHVDLLSALNKGPEYFVEISHYLCSIAYTLQFIKLQVILILF